MRSLTPTIMYAAVGQPATGDWGEFIGLYDPLFVELALTQLNFTRALIHWKSVTAHCDELIRAAQIFKQEDLNG